MIAILEDAIVGYAKRKDHRWLALLSQWLQAIGVLRLRHITRSYPLRVTGSTLYAYCQRGNQRSKRNGFEWSAPSRFITQPFDWTEPFLAEWSKLPLSRGESVGMAFDIRAKPLHECGVH